MDVVNLKNGMFERFCQTTNQENMVYDEMVEYADFCNPDCVGIYVDLYKCANTPEQHKHVLEHILSFVIDEDTFTYHDEIIQNLREIVSLVDCLDEKDDDMFDAICMKVLNFFRNQYQSSVWETGQYGHVPEASIAESSKELIEVAEIIISTDMHNMRSYRMALSVLGA